MNEILLVEDNPGDARLTLEAFKEGNIEDKLRVVEDGQAALDYLNKVGSYQDANTPDMILLDLNLPKLDGREVLAAIKADEDLRRIPVVVLTTSKADEDVLRVYNLHANCYITKPVEWNNFLDVVGTLQKFWLSMVQLPPK